MKRILAFTLLILFLISSFAPLSFAKEDEIPTLMEDPDPFGLGFEDEKEDPYAELSELECLHKGLIRVYDGMTAEDLRGYMQVVDNSEGRYNTQKLFYLMDMILNTYYGDLTAEALTDAFLGSLDYIDVNDMESVYKKLFSVLDRFTYYLTADEAKSFFNPNDSRAVGISTVWYDKDESHPVAGMYVENIAPLSSAYNAGIKRGDRLLQINRVDVTGLGFNAVSAILREESRDRDFMEYVFELYGEDGGIFEYTLERTDVTFSEFSVERYPEKSTVLIDLNGFMNGTTAYDLSDAIDGIWQDGYRNVILDLQSNSGGSVDVAAAIASKFTPDPFRVLFHMGTEENPKMYPYYSMGNGYEFDSVTILVNSSSASSAEILTDTLRKMVGARVVGSTTYGKGVAQQTVKFLDGTAVGITAFVAYDKNGETYNEKGITPDEEVYPEVKRNSLSLDTESLTYGNFESAVMGAENFATRALEKRLVLLQYLSPHTSDGVFDYHTALALRMLQTDYELEITGEMNEETLDVILTLTRQWENSYTVTSTVLDYVMR